MGHIELKCPVVHIWFLKSMPSRIGTILDLKQADLDRIIHYISYIVTDPGLVPELRKNQILSQEEYEDFRASHGNNFVAKMGAEAILELIKSINLEAEIANLKEQIEVCSAETKKKKLTKRLRLLDTFYKSGNKPEWMILTVLPVLPPNLRPLVPLDGGRYATADLNELYRSVVTRNNRLGRLLDGNFPAPDLIINQEKRLLQESVDALLDNSRKSKPVTGSNRRPFKSLTDIIKGKKGRFRQNLLGKRVDYSGRSVISVGPYLRLHQCGLPKQMAKELFRPFIYSQLINMGKAEAVKTAKKLVDREDPALWDALDVVIKQHPVLLNRAPTLHRLGIQAFEPVLIEGKVIQLHPLVCSAFNADFDGDQMAVHVPLTLEAQLEARVLMMSTNNILSPANGDPVIVPSQDMVLGLYYLTCDRINVKGEGMCFASPKDAEIAYLCGEVDLHARVKVRITEYKKLEDISEEDNDKIIWDQAQLVDNMMPITTLTDTTVGRAILWQIAPRLLSFNLFNKSLTKDDISRILNDCTRILGNQASVELADQIMYTGFKYAAISGVSICIDDMLIPPQKEKFIRETKELISNQTKGHLSADERKNTIIDAWGKCVKDVERAMMENLKVETVIDANGNAVQQPSMNSLYMMTVSKARGSTANVRQIAGMRGNMTRPDGSIIPTPIISNFREGLTVQEYFMSTHGARKGLTDTALKTANSGYLTRRLVDVAQDVVINNVDCGTSKYILVQSVIEGEEVKVKLKDRALGRTLALDVYHPRTNIKLANKGDLIDEHLCEVFNEANVYSLAVRSPVLCENEFGICQKCYGRDLARSAEVNEGEAVGIIAAQSIGEPGTQLTMRTINTGGVATHTTINSSIKVNNAGTVEFENIKYVEDKRGHIINIGRNVRLNIVDKNRGILESYRLPYGAICSIKEGEQTVAGSEIAKWDPNYQPTVSTYAGRAQLVDFVEGLTVELKDDEETGLSQYTVIAQTDRPATARDLRPSIYFLDENGERIRNQDGSEAHILFSKCVITNVVDGYYIDQGEIIGRTPNSGKGARDITGGLTRVSDLFEARKPKDAAILAEIDGVVSHGKETKGKHRIIINNLNANDELGFDTDTENFWEVAVPKWRIISVEDGEEVKKGDVISDGPESAHDILRLRGDVELTRFIVEEVQQVYRDQGIKINDKHIEVIIRQMLRKVTILDPVDSEYIPGEQVEYSSVIRENKIREKVGKPLIQFRRELLGITKAALATESFISAASFQETTKVLVEAAIAGKRDELRGLKENVIVGRLIPSGTGYDLAKRKELARKKQQLKNEMFPTK